MILSTFEWTVARRYLRPGRGEAFIAMVAGISLVAVALGVAALIIVMCVMNGFRAELFDKVSGLNGHAVIQGYGGRLDNWQDIVKSAKATPGVIQASPLIEQPLLGSFNGRVSAMVIHGQTAEDIAKLSAKVVAGNIKDLRADSGNVAIGKTLAEDMGVQVGDSITIINPAGRSTPFGTVPRQVSYTVAAIFEIGVYDFDKAFVIMPIHDAQTLLLIGDAISGVEIKVDNPDRVTEILAPLSAKWEGHAAISDWKAINGSLFQALAEERVVMFVICSLIVLVAAFNILSSLIMLVRAKMRDIAIMRTMGASRRSVMKIFMTVGCTIGGLGTGLGCILATLFLVFRQNVVNFIQMLTGQNLWDPKIRFLTQLPAKPDTFEIGAIIILALGLSFAFTLFPALKAASTDPVQVLRYE
ncbi:lipoprotein-releasing ABC transporter permease subunit [Novosphingobium terrae]|uniref:lipoprotein-releasing ABC transporter permease subunit n=1 Tax=Novosphingobium terrae TaxID=2726189 RepID=UPI001980F9D6|nr:lipoprotein-releasing ABC transporter permease subunit [Novosphingobium terrae]